MKRNLNVCKVYYDSRREKYRRIKRILGPGEKPTQVELRRYEQKRKSKWRQLGLFVKAKFQSVICGFETFPQAFMPHIVLNDGELLGEKVLREVTNIKQKSKTISTASKPSKLKAS